MTTKRVHPWTEVIEGIGGAGTTERVYHPGITYREWLIGLVAGGIAANPASMGTQDPNEFAMIPLRFADAVIAAMEKEKKG